MSAPARSRRAVPLAALGVLGLAAAFGGGWAVGSATSGTGGRLTPLSAEALRGATAAAGGTTSPRVLGVLPTDLPTGEIPDAGSAPGSSVSAAASSVVPAAVALPSVAKVKAPPVKKFRCPRATVTVADADALDDALDNASPGDVIRLRNGVYQDKFTATADGTAKKPIYLCGGRKAVLDGGSVTGGYVLHLDGASYWRLDGFTVRNGQKGVVVDGATRVAVQNLLVETIGDEAVHLRDGTTRSVVRGSTIRDTGHRKPKFGEGVYVGTAQSNWCSISDCKPDHSDHNYVLDNTISATTSENVDIKEGTVGGVVAGNRFNGARITGADSWVDVKGNGWLISGNRGTKAPYDGYQQHEILSGWGARNLFVANTSSVGAAGYAIKITKTHSGNVVRCSNKATGAQEGLSNVRCAE